DYRSLFEREIELRRALAFPPFARMINVRIEGELEEQVRTTAKKMAGLAARLVSRHGSVNILGPAPAPLAKLHNRYRWQLLLKGNDLKALHTTARALVDSRYFPAPAAIKLSLDVDPENML
ncbi:MAG: primosomal protein N', partial [Thermodesulfobacteriota bacterium]